MKYHVWESLYKPIPVKHSPCVPEGTTSPFGNTMHETYGDEYDIVLQRLRKEPHAIWTLIEEDGSMYIVPGFRFVNRLGYFLCDKPWVDPRTNVPISDID